MKLSKSEIERKVKEILSEVLVAPKESITLNANLAHDLGADSLDNVEIVINVFGRRVWVYYSRCSYRKIRNSRRYY